MFKVADIDDSGGILLIRACYKCYTRTFDDQAIVAVCVLRLHSMCEPSR